MPSSASFNTNISNYVIIYYSRLNWTLDRWKLFLIQKIKGDKNKSKVVAEIDITF